jgi:hypothetical protein
VIGLSALQIRPDLAYEPCDPPIIRRSAMTPLARAFVLSMLTGSAAVVAGEAAAQSPSCQADFQKIMEPRQKIIERINGFRSKRPTPGQACSTLGELVAADGKLIAWLTENKDWCQIPDQLIEQLQTASGQASRSRGQACTAAKNQASQIARARAQQRAAQGAPAVGSGVRLPQGAL